MIEGSGEDLSTSGAGRGIARAAALRTALWLVLGGWIGGFLLFGAAVAPTAFRVLPTTEVAGQLIGPVLGFLQVYGAVAGLALAILARAMGRGGAAVVLPLSMAVICLYSHFGVTAAIAEVRELALGPAGTEEGAARFASLHRRSMLLFYAASLLSITLVGVHAWADARSARR